MASIQIIRSIDIEETIRAALSPYVTAYVRPLPAKLTLPCVEIQQVGGTDQNTIDTFEVVLDTRAESEAEAIELLRNTIGILKTISKEQTSAIRFVGVNSSGSWGADPVRPDLAMCSARLRVVAHQENITFNGGT